MKGYTLGTAVNTNDWVVYDNDISVGYEEFLKGQYIREDKPPLFYNVHKKSYYNRVKSAVMLESSGALLVSRRFKELLNANTKGVQFFDVEFYCGNERVDGFYAMNVMRKIPCLDMENSEYRRTNFDDNNPEYMFYYMKLKNNIFNEEVDADIVICKEMPRYLIVSERLKDALVEAKLKGLKFSSDIDMTPQNRTRYEII